jgi:hypothetical protein
MSTLKEILDIVRAPQINFDELEDALDSATHEERVAASREWDTAIQRKLYDQAQGRPVRLEQLVPTERPLQPVHHWGRNTVFPGFHHFQKRFTRPEDRDDVLYGYNETWYKFATTPGYYTAYEDEQTGQVVVDYTRLPEDRPDHWPGIRPNWHFLGLVVFHGMKDRLWSVSDHVTIGRAFKKKPMNQWFVLVRED